MYSFTLVTVLYIVECFQILLINLGSQCSAPCVSLSFILYCLFALLVVR